MRRFIASSLILATSFVILNGCSSDTDEPEQQSSEPVQIDLTQETGYFGWDTASLRNIYAELNILPEFGGRLMGYDVLGSRLLWHDAAHEGEIGDFNPGGAWVMPGGAELGDWPDDSVSPYATTAWETAMTDSTVSMEGAGEEFRISVEGTLEPKSTIFRQRYTLERTAGGGQAGLRQVISIPVDEDVMVYAPVADGGIRVIAGGEDNPQWLGIENGIFRAQYDRRYGRVGLRMREGWLAWRQVKSSMTFVARFPIDAAGYPGGYQAEIRTLGEGEGPDGPLTYDPGTARMEVVLMSGIDDLDSGDSLTMDITWEVSRVSDVVQVLPHGILSQEFRMRDGKYTGKFGVFRGGFLQYVYFDGNRDVLGNRNMYEINPVNEVVIDHGGRHFTFPPAMRYLGFKVTDLDRNDLQMFGDIPLPQ